MKKVLFTATVVRTHIATFHLPFLKALRGEGYETHVAARNDCPGGVVDLPGCVYHEIAFERNPFHPGNIVAYFRLKRLIDSENFDIIHCHTPVGGILTRLAARRARKRGTKVLYTAHGFHFYRGAPKKNWIIYYPIERLCSRWTDVIITINREDYELAKKKMKAGSVRYIPGVGIDVDKFANTVVDRAAKRREIDVPEDAFLLLSVGELNKNKNHQVIIRAMAQLGDKRIHYAVAGLGNLRDSLTRSVEALGVGDNVHFLGYRNDIAELYHASDIYVFPSMREGLPVALMEALQSGLPCVASRIRGNTDLIEDGVNGYLCSPDDQNAFAQAIKRLLDAPDALTGVMGKNSDVSRQYDTAVINRRMLDIYDALGK